MTAPFHRWLRCSRSIDRRRDALQHSMAWGRCYATDAVHDLFSRSQPDAVSNVPPMPTQKYSVYSPSRRKWMPHANSISKYPVVARSHESKNGQEKERENRKQIQLLLFSTLAIQFIHLILVDALKSNRIPFYQNVHSMEMSQKMGKCEECS